MLLCVEAVCWCVWLQKRLVPCLFLSAVQTLDPLLQAVVLLCGVVAGVYERHCDSVPLCCACVVLHASGGFESLYVAAGLCGAPCVDGVAACI